MNLRGCVFALVMLASGMPAAAQTVDLISKAGFPRPNGVDAYAMPHSMSRDGRFVLFSTQATDVVPNQVDTNGTSFEDGQDLFLADTQTGSIALVSHRMGSVTTTGNIGYFNEFQISADGAWVCFSGRASDLVPGDLNGLQDVFLYERATGEIRLVSHADGASSPAEGGWTDGPALSADGSAVAFMSGGNAYVYDRATGAITLVSHGASPDAGSGGVWSAVMSADGRTVAFESSATDVGTGLTLNGQTQLFLFDRDTSAIRLVSHAASPTAAASGNAYFRTYEPQLSADGAWVAFVSDAPDLGQGIIDGNGKRDVFLYEKATGAIRLVSHLPSNLQAASGSSYYPDISDDGSVVSFESRASNLVDPSADTNGQADVFVYERETGDLSLVSHTAAMKAGNGGSQWWTGPVLSADGMWVAFTTYATDLAGGNRDLDGNEDVYLYERASGGLTLLSHTSGRATTAAGGGMDLTISGDGSAVGFATGSPTGSGALTRVAVWSRAVNAVTVVSVSRAVSASATATEEYDGLTTSQGRQATSTDGRFVVFTSSASNLVPGQRQGHAHTDILGEHGAAGDELVIDVFLADRRNGTMTLVSHAWDSPTITANASSWSPVISRDGSWVAFVSRASDLVGGIGDENGATNVFLWSRATGKVTLVSHRAGDEGAGNGASDKPAISGDGGGVVFTSQATDLVAGVSDTNGQADVFLYDRAGARVTLVSHAASATNARAFGSGDVVISADGAWVAFTGVATGPEPWFSSVFLFERATGAITLVSHTSDPETPGNSASSRAALSGDGAWVAFVSGATNLGSGITGTQTSPNVFLYDRVTDTITLVSHTSSSTTGGNSSSVSPEISTDGTAVVFTSWATNLGAGFSDANGTNDVFLYDRPTGTLSLVSHISSATTTGEAASAMPVIDDAGDRVAFQSLASNLGDGITKRSSIDDNEVFLYDRTLGSVSLVSHTPASPTVTGNSGNRDLTQPAISGDGRSVVFWSLARDLYPGDLNRRSDVFAYQQGAPQFHGVADVSVSLSDGRASVTAGSITTYTMVVRNAGPDGVEAEVLATWPAGIGSASWTCVASAGSFCGTASGQGTIQQGVVLASGGALTYTIEATVSASASGTLVSTAQVAMPPKVTDAVSANDSASDADVVTPPVAGGDDSEPGSARNVLVGSTVSGVLGATPGEEHWFRFRLSEGHSYCVEVDNGKTDVTARHTVLAVFEIDAATIVGRQGASTQLSRACLIASSSGSHLARVVAGPSGTPGGFRLRVVETTLFAPWFMTGNGIDAFVLLRGTTSDAHEAVVTAYGPAGNVTGTASGSVPADGNWNLLLASPPPMGLSLPSGGGSLMIAHDGPPGALTGTVTMLNPATGLSLDTPVAPRQDFR